MCLEVEKLGTPGFLRESKGQDHPPTGLGRGKALEKQEVRQSRVLGIKSVVGSLVQKPWTRARGASLASLQSGTWHM